MKLMILAMGGLALVISGCTADYNERLSLQRAQAVKLQMVARGVPVSNIEVLGQGESQPLASNGTPQGRAKNRRVELHITVDQSKFQ